MVHVRHPTCLPVYTAPGQLLPERGGLAHREGCVRRKWGTLPLQYPLRFPGFFRPPGPLQSPGVGPEQQGLEN